MSILYPNAYSLIPEFTYDSVKVTVGEVQYLKTFFNSHTAWLDTKFNSSEYQ